MQEQNQVLSTLIHGTNKQKCPQSVRKFCLRLLFHSRAAYNEIRNFFNNHLPAQRSIQRWLRCIDASPGITQMALDAVTEQVQKYKDQNKKLYISVVHDEITIRKNVSYNEGEKSFDGFSTQTNQNTNNEQVGVSVAKDALVYMAVGPDFRIAIAYFFLNGLQAIDRAALTNEVIKAVECTGAIVLTLTGDGLIANIKSYAILGADFESDKPFFPSPLHAERKIYIIFDPAHMLKLLRKDFSVHKLYHNDELLNWDLLKKLAAKQDTDNFGLGNQLTLRRHIHWDLSPMTVRYAVETMSNGVADILEQLCEDNYADFVGCESTIKFIRLVNNLFDIMNYGDGKKTNNQFKQPINESTMPEFLELFNQFKNFINELSVIKSDSKTSKKVAMLTFTKLKSNAFVGFSGFVQNIASVVGIYNDYVLTGLIDTFYTFQFSQDNLETYFSLIRSSLGANVNPTTQQFMSAYRKLLLVMPHMSSNHTNCNYFEVSNILNVTVPAQTPAIPSHDDIIRTTAIEIDEDYETLISKELDPYEQHMVAYISTCIEANIIRKIKSQSVSACQDCLSVFSENTKIYDNFIEKKKRSGHQLVQPCCSTRDIIKVCNSVLKILQPTKYVDYKVISKTTWSILHIDELYQLSEFNDHQHEHEHVSSRQFGHKELFIFNIIQEYFRIKSVNIGRRITDEEWQESMKRRRARRVRILDGR